jgi:hypothetical protein
MLKRLGQGIERSGIADARFSSWLELFREPENLTNIRRELVMEFLQKYHPSSMEELKNKLASEGIRSSDDDLLEVIQELQRDGEIRLLRPVHLNSFPGFLADPSNSWWIYGTLLLSLAEIFLVSYNAQDSFFQGARLLFGLGLLGFLPGYASVQILFPKDRPSLLEQILMSIFISVMVSISLGVALGAGYFFSPVSGVLLSGIYAMLASLFAGYRRYSALRVTRRGAFRSA